VSEGDGPDSARADVWLWRARLYKTRATAAAALRAGRIRIDGAKAHKAHAALRPGMVLTIAAPGRVRVLRIRALGVRRGPAVEAQTLYDDA